MKVFKTLIALGLAMNTYHTYSMIKDEAPCASQKELRSDSAKLLMYLDKIKPSLPRNLKGSAPTDQARKLMA